MKAFSISLLYLVFLTSIVFGQSGSSALLSSAMREYQARYRALNGGNEDSWPSVFNCRYTGMPAPANPSDSYFSEEVEDPERLAELTQSLLDTFKQNYFYKDFVSNYETLKAGKAEKREVYDITKLGLSGMGDISAGNAASTLV